MSDRLSILFAGTPEIAVPSLDALLQSEHDLVAVVTAPDRPSGRGRRLAPSPVKVRAAAAGVPVLQPSRLGSDAREAVRHHAPDLLVCVAYGRIFGPRFLGLFRLGGINLHPSLLPRHRGPAPIPAAILAGDAETGVTVQALAREMDAGDIFAQQRIPLTGRETTGTLTVELANRGASLLVEVVDAIAAGTASRRPQDHQAATYTGLIRKSDGEIHWNLPAREIARRVRGYNPWPLAHTTFGGRRLNILECGIVGDEDPQSTGDGSTDTRPVIAGTVVRVDNQRGILVETGNGRLALTKLQLQSRKALMWDSFLNGTGDFLGTVLGG